MTPCVAEIQPRWAHRDFVNFKCRVWGFWCSRCCVASYDRMECTLIILLTLMHKHIWTIIPPNCSHELLLIWQNSKIQSTAGKDCALHLLLCPNMFSMWSRTYDVQTLRDVANPVYSGNQTHIQLPRADEVIACMVSCSFAKKKLSNTCLRWLLCCYSPWSSNKACHE